MKKTPKVDKVIKAFTEIAKSSPKDSEFEEMTKTIQLIGKKVANHTRLPYAIIKATRVVAKYMEADGTKFAPLIMELKKVTSNHIAVFLNRLPEKEKQEMEEFIEEILALHL